MDNRFVLNIKKENCFGYFTGKSYGLMLGKVVDFSDTLVTFDNSPTPIDYALIRRIEVNQFNCESFGWKKDPATLSTFIINDKSAVIFDSGHPVFACRKPDGIMLVEITHLDELQEAFRLVLQEELPIRRY